MVHVQHRYRREAIRVKPNPASDVLFTRTLLELLQRSRAYVPCKEATFDAEAQDVASLPRGMCIACVQNGMTGEGCTCSRNNIHLPFVGSVGGPVSSPLYFVPCAHAKVTHVIAFCPSCPVF